jgi:hypothetical protein
VLSETGGETPPQPAGETPALPFNAWRMVQSDCFKPVRDFLNVKMPLRVGPALSPQRWRKAAS